MIGRIKESSRRLNSPLAACTVKYVSKPTLHQICNFLQMPHFTHILPCKAPLLFGRHHIDHLSADGACLSCCEVSVVTVLKVYANLACSFHLESFHGFSAFVCDVVFHCFNLLNRNLWVIGFALVLYETQNQILKKIFSRKISLTDTKNYIIILYIHFLR